MSSSSSVSFFAVGCWNRGVVPEQSLVFDFIIHNQDKMDKLLILGDNVYSNEDSIFPDNPNKIGLDKNQHSLDVYNRGLERVLISSDGKLLTKDVYFVLGNHDVGIKQNNCEIYQTQLKINETNKQLFTRFPYYFEDIYSADKSTCVRLICIDTNFDDLDIDYSKNSCIQRNANTTNLSQLKVQLVWLKNVLKTSKADYILIMGHHPIVYNKMKKGKPKKGFIPSLIDLFGRYAHKNITYLCADTHLYQNWTLTYTNGRTVKEIICGTGGAVLDEGDNPEIDFPEDFVQFHKDKEISYVNGFCYLNFEKRTSTIDFCEVLKNPPKKDSKNSKNHKTSS